MKAYAVNGELCILNNKETQEVRVSEIAAKVERGDGIMLMLKSGEHLIWTGNESIPEFNAAVKEANKEMEKKVYEWLYPIRPDLPGYPEPPEDEICDTKEKG